MCIRDSSGAVQATVLVRSSPKSWLDEGPAFNLMPQQDWGQVFQQNKDKLQRHNLVVYLHGNFTSYFAGKQIPPVKEPSPGDTGAMAQIQVNEKDKDRTIIPSNTGRHLVVAGDADFLSEQNAAPGNIAFLLNVVDWLTLDENLIGIRSRTLVDRTIRNDQLQKGSSLPAIIRMTNILLMPGILIIIGLILFFRRRDASAGAKPATAKPQEPASPANKEAQ